MGETALLSLLIMLSLIGMSEQRMERTQRHVHMEAHLLPLVLDPLQLSLGVGNVSP